MRMTTETDEARVAEAQVAILNCLDGLDYETASCALADAHNAFTRVAMGYEGPGVGMTIKAHAVACLADDLDDSALVAQAASNGRNISNLLSEARQKITAAILTLSAAKATNNGGKAA